MKPQAGPDPYGEDHSVRFARIRRLKRLLRFMPRRATLHRYPVLKWFAASARKRAYLWSFRVSEVVPAFYMGWVLTLLPLYGLQILLAFVFALMLRANLMIMVALQLVSNPLTVVPLWYLDFLIGRPILELFLGPLPIDFGYLLRAASAAGLGFIETFQFVLSETRAHGAGAVTRFMVRLVLSTALGAVILGLVLGFLSATAYRWLAWRTERGGFKMRRIIHPFTPEKPAEGEPSSEAPMEKK